MSQVQTIPDFKFTPLTFSHNYKSLYCIYSNLSTSSSVLFHAWSSYLSKYSNLGSYESRSLTTAPISWSSCPFLECLFTFKGYELYVWDHGFHGSHGSRFLLFSIVLLFLIGCLSSCWNFLRSEDDIPRVISGGWLSFGSFRKCQCSVSWPVAGVRRSWRPFLCWLIEKLLNLKSISLIELFLKLNW